MRSGSNIFRFFGFHLFHKCKVWGSIVFKFGPFLILGGFSDEKI